MDWGEKIKKIGSALLSLQEEAQNLIGSANLKSIEMCCQQKPIEYYLENTKHLRVYPVESKGVRCVILSSKIYPEFGILLFDAPSPFEQSGVSGVFIKGHKFIMVCGCCTPYKEGVGIITENLQMDFEKSIRESCKKNGIRFLWFRSYSAMKMSSDKELHLIEHDRDIKNFPNLNFWKLASAFHEITIDEKSMSEL
jgi:hypothetical protein